MNIENDTTTSVIEVDKVGGWLLTHYTRTWTERKPLADLQAQIDAKEEAIAKLQADKAALEAKLPATK